MIATRSEIELQLARAGCVAADEEADELLVVAAGDTARLLQMLTRRLAGEPLAWVTGRVIFCGVEVRVHDGVYVPRPQSEALVRRAASALPADGVAVDLCTGSGALALALAKLVPGARVLATDLDDRAVACAVANGVEAYQGDLDAPLPAELAGRVDVLVGVVPYVPTPELVFLPRDVLDHEPRLALDGGEDGTTFLRRALAAADRLLAPTGVALLELGGEEAARLDDELARLGLRVTHVLVDEEDDVRGIEVRRVVP